MSRKNKILLVGSFTSWQGALEKSYASAFESLGMQTIKFDLQKRINHYTLFGKLGLTLNRFWPVEAWIRKANREIVLAALEEKPDLIVVFGQSLVQPGTLAQIATMSNAKLIMIWPDTLVNISTQTLMCLPLYDLVASYGKHACAIFEKLGARRAEWIPLAADPELHPLLKSEQASSCDVSFVGNWKPEREYALSLIIKSLDVSVKIWGGNDWKRFAGKNASIMSAWQGKGAFGEEFAKVVGASKINLNIIDLTNFPSANMRFFEIPCARGLQVCSSCPEMENIFINGETIFYYKSPEDLPELVYSLLGNERLRNQVTRNANEFILQQHTYKDRAKKILELLN